MKQITNNLFIVSGKGIFPSIIFVLEKENGNITIVDTGLSKDINSIIRKIKKKWGSLEKIERIIITHRHYDHTGGLERIINEMVTISAEAPPEEKIEIVIHEAEEPYFLKDVEKWKIKPNRLVKHEEIIDKELKIKAINNPGHTFGHLCLLLENEKLLLTGDSFMNVFGLLIPVPKAAHDNFNQYFQTLPILLKYDWDYAIPSHIKPKKISREKIEKFILKKKK